MFWIFYGDIGDAPHFHARPMTMTVGDKEGTSFFVSGAYNMKNIIYFEALSEFIGKVYFWIATADVGCLTLDYKLKFIKGRK